MLSSSRLVLSSLAVMIVGALAASASPASSHHHRSHHHHHHHHNSSLSIVDASYSLVQNYDASNWINSFTFQSIDDPTHGYVDYTTLQQAQDWDLLKIGSAVYMGVDSTSVSSGRGRASIRIQSNRQFTTGLFIGDFAHMPGSVCGVWPAFWTTNSNWPNQGEIDIIEGVSLSNYNSMTLHTSAGCDVNENGVAQGTSPLDNADCNTSNANVGCGEQSPAGGGAYGDDFNNNGGGVYAMEWTNNGISIWHFSRNNIPADITQGNPNPNGWGAPVGKFNPSGCDIGSHFSQHSIIFDTTFCGDWAGSVWNNDATCGRKAASCVDYVQNNPSAFQDAYWIINSVKVYNAAADIEKYNIAVATD